MSRKVLSLQNKIKKTYAKNLIPFAIPLIILKFGFHDFWCTFVLLNQEWMMWIWFFQGREQENSVSRQRLGGNDDGSVEAEKEKDRKLAETTGKVCSFCFCFCNWNLVCCRRRLLSDVLVSVMKDRQRENVNRTIMMMTINWNVRCEEVRTEDDDDDDQELSQ